MILSEGSSAHIDEIYVLWKIDVDWLSLSQCALNFILQIQGFTVGAFSHALLIAIFITRHLLMPQECCLHDPLHLTLSGDADLSYLLLYVNLNSHSKEFSIKLLLWSHAQWGNHYSSSLSACLMLNAYDRFQTKIVSYLFYNDPPIATWS